MRHPRLLGSEGRQAPANSHTWHHHAHPRPAPRSRAARRRAVQSSGPEVDALVERAEGALQRARSVIMKQQNAERGSIDKPSFIPASLTFGAPLRKPEQPAAASVASPSEAAPTPPSLRGAGDAPAFRDTRDRPPDLRAAGAATKPLDAAVVAEAEGAVAGASGEWHTGPSEAPPMQLQRSRAATRAVALDFAEALPSDLTLRTQREIEAEEAALPPLQSVVELTSAHLSPAQQAAELEATGGTQGADELRHESAAGHLLEDGEGVLADGTWRRVSGEEKDDNGYWCRWWVLSGTALGGKVEWEETWWESSDWSGMREMGAQKVGCNVSGDAWRESWTERVFYEAGTGEPFVTRSAEKWAREAEASREWEEKWGEHYGGGGAVNKWAEKWGKDGGHVWHEKWGEDYAKGHDACMKYTDRWSEVKQLDGSVVKQGDKWREEFGSGEGNKTGETWHEHADGSRWSRMWGENHHGGGWVQKYGHSTSGEQWDSTEQTGTYYNPKPHFTFDMALDHSPDLLRIPVRPREESAEDLLAGGMENF